MAESLARRAGYTIHAMAWTSQVRPPRRQPANARRVASHPHHGGEPGTTRRRAGQAMA